MRLSRLLHFDEDATAQSLTVQLLESGGLKRFISRLPAGLETKIDAQSLSGSERRRLSAIRAVRSGAPLLLLDEPLIGLSQQRSAAFLDALLSAAGDATVIVTTNRVGPTNAFDRVIQLRRGRISFDGTPDAWRQQRRAGKKSSGGFSNGERRVSTSIDPRRRTG